MSATCVKVHHTYTTAYPSENDVDDPYRYHKSRNETGSSSFRVFMATNFIAYVKYKHPVRTCIIELPTR